MKKKLLLILLCLVAIFAVSALTACDMFNKSDDGKQVETGTTDETGNDDDGNDGNGGGGQQQTHTHTLEKVDATEAKCTATGMKEHWKCTGCKKYFSDAEGKTEVKQADLVIPATGHQYSHYTCTECQDKLSTTSGMRFELNAKGTGYIVADVNVGYISSGLTTLVIPETYSGKPVTEIGEDAFEYTQGDSEGHKGHYAANSPLRTITHVYLPDSLEEIGDGAFANCPEIRYVYFGNSVTRIGNSVFTNCKKLESIDIPDCVKNIGSSAFFGCDGVKSIVIGKGVEYIGTEAFSKGMFTQEGDLKLETVVFKEPTGWQTKSKGGKSWSANKTDLTVNANAIQFLRKTNVNNMLGRNQK